MRLVGVSGLTANNILAMPVRTSRGNIILNAGIMLTEIYITKLKQLGVNRIYIEDERFSEVEYAEELDSRIWNSAVQVIGDTYKSIHEGSAFNEYSIKDIANSLVNHALNLKDRSISTMSTNVIDDFIVEHAINVALISIYLGMKMSYNFNQLCDLAIGALIHDLGRENKSEETKEHTSIGFNFFRSLRGISLHSSIVCLQHHENHDGSGYPRKLKGNEISEYTKIIKVADVYDSVLNSYTAEQNITLPHLAFEYVIAASGKELDPDIVELFRDTTVFYPNGCTVVLSNNLKGVVIRQNQGNPQRPVVKVFNDSSIIGEIDLAKKLTLFVKDVVIS